MRTWVLGGVPSGTGVTAVKREVRERADHSILNFPRVSRGQELIDYLPPSSALSPQGLTDHPHLFQERLAVLDSQAGQIRAQAVQESERLARDKNASLQLLQKVAQPSGREGGVGVGVGEGGSGWKGSAIFPLHLISSFAVTPTPI